MNTKSTSSPLCLQRVKKLPLFWTFGLTAYDLKLLLCCSKIPSCTVELWLWKMIQVRDVNEFVDLWQWKILQVREWVCRAVAVKDDTDTGREWVCRVVAVKDDTGTGREWVCRSLAVKDTTRTCAGTSMSVVLAHFWPAFADLMLLDFSVTKGIQSVNTSALAVTGEVELTTGC